MVRIERYAIHCRFLVHPRDEILQAIQRIYRYRMTTTSGGNLSIREENGDVWITPARLDKGTLRREDIVRVSADGTVHGPHRPSSELPFHQEIYRTRPDIRGIVHAHPVALVAFSLVHQVPDTRLFHQARHVCGEAGFAPYELPGSLALGRNVAAIFGQGFDCVLLENHGAGHRWMPDLAKQAFRRFETLEFTAKTIIKARLLGDVSLLDRCQEIALAREVASGVDPPFRIARSRHERSGASGARLAEFVRRAYRQRLLHQAHAGQFLRARGCATSFLITPLPARTAARIDVQDLVAGRATARAKQGHPQPRGAPPRRPSTVSIPRGRRAIVTAYPVNAIPPSASPALRSMFGRFPESYIVIRQVSPLPVRPAVRRRSRRLLRTWPPQTPRRAARKRRRPGRRSRHARSLRPPRSSRIHRRSHHHPVRASARLAPMPDSVTKELDRVFLSNT